MAVADLTTSDGRRIFVETLNGRTGGTIYSDPPWSPGNEKYWRRHAKEMPPNAYDELLDGWCRCVVAARPAHVFVEQSINDKHSGLLMAAIGRCAGWTWPLVEKWRVRYGAKNKATGERLPNELLHFGPAPIASDPTDLNGEAMTRTVLSGLSLGGFIADPCTGLGTSSRMAHEFGVDFVGTELNSTRLDRTADWLRRHAYTEASAVAHGEPAQIGPALSINLSAAHALPARDRISLFNETQRKLAALVADLTTDPAATPRLLPIGSVLANDYNPNKVASVEMDLLEQSIKADGITMPVVVMQRDGEWIVVDGFHRRTVAAKLGREYLPCSVLDKPLADRMASTVRHNRARGKHQVELMAALVKGMMDLGWDDEHVAAGLGMSVEELLRLRQMVGAAALLAGATYSRSWGTIDAGPDAERET